MATEKAEQGNWDDFNNEAEKKEGAGKKSGDLEFMIMNKPGKYNMRLVGKHVKFHRYFKPFMATTHSSYGDQDPVKKAGWYAQERYAIFVIDRADGRLKILEKGKGVFASFAAYKDASGINPAGKDGPDFCIQVKIPKDEKGEYIKLETEYIVTSLASSPFTDKELEMIKENADKIKALPEIFKSTPLEKIKEMWEALPENKRTPPKKKAKANTEKAESKTEKKQDAPPAEVQEDDPPAEDPPADDAGDAGTEDKEATDLF